VAVVDRNGFQANLRTEELIPLEPLRDKWEAFGWACRSVHGHSFPVLEEAFRELPLRPGRPTAVVAQTVRGKGVPSLEARVDRWFADFTAEEIEALLRELRGGARADLRTGGTVVR
jgi:transketolase